MKFRLIAMAFAAALSCFVAVAAPAEPPHHAASLHSRDDGAGTRTYWGDGASYEIVGPGVTVFFLRRGDGGVVPPMIRVAYVGDRWINLRGVTFSVGGRTFGPYADIYSKPTRIEAGTSLFVESLLFNVDSEEKWQMLEAISESDELGRPVIAVFDGDSPYGIELDRASKRATGQVVRAFRGLTVTSN